VKRAGMWPPERDALLAQHWASGLSSLAIARAMGVTKRAVIGRAHRLGLPPRPSPIRPRDPSNPVPPRKARAAVPRAPQPGQARAVPAVLDGSSLNLPPSATVQRSPPAASWRPPPRRGMPGTLAPASTCQFPLWPDAGRPPRPPRYCGQASIAGASYCAAHQARCWGRGTPAERRADNTLLACSEIAR